MAGFAPLTVAECFRWWDPAVMERLCEWSAATIAQLPSHIRDTLGTANPGDLSVALGLVLLLHDEYDLRPECRLLPDEISTLLQTSAESSLMLANSDLQQHLPYLIFTGTLDCARRGWCDYMPSSLINDAGDRFEIDCVPPQPSP